MTDFRDYLDSSLPDKKGGDLIYKFKRKMLDEMNERYREVSSRGIKDDKVITDLIKSEHPDLRSEYQKYYKSETGKARAKRRVILNAAGSVIYILSLLVAYLGISFSTHDWGHTWVIMVDGILLLTAYLLNLGVIRITSFRRIFHFIARILLGIEVMVLVTAFFILSVAILHLPHAWTIVIGGVAMIFIADGIYALITKQRLYVLNFLVYIPSVATMAYIILAGTGVISWERGWLLIIAGLLADFIVILSTLLRSQKRDMEAYEEWNEN